MGGIVINTLAEMFTGAFARRDSHSKTEFASHTKRDTFSSYLPWLTYSQDEKAFLMCDNTIGYMWELRPLVYQGYKETAAIEGVIKQGFPEGTVMQWVLFPDSDIEPILDYYISSKPRLDEVGEKTINETAKFFRKATKGVSNLRGVPVRNFRAFMCIKSDANLLDFIPTIEEMLEGAGLAPRRMDDRALLNLMDRIINDIPAENREYSTVDESEVYTRDKPLRSYAVKRETEIDFSGSYPIIGGRYACCLTPDKIPASINPLQINNLFGGVMGVEDDAAQHNYPFLYSCNIVYSNVADELASKAAVTMGQSAAGSFAHALKLRINEFNRFRSDSAKNKGYVKVIPTLWVFGETEQAIEKNIARAKMVFGRSDTGKFVLQREHVLSQALFIASLPGGLYNVLENLTTLDRHFYMSDSAAARFVPVQGDYAGNGRPVSLFVGRKGQIAGLDFFAPQSPNHNFLVTAESGGGKSFVLNTILDDYFLSGEKVRIVDIGGSYEKLCKTKGGKYIDFKLDSNDQCINPLDFIVKRKADGEPDVEDLTQNLKAAALVFCEMVYSQSKIAMPEHESQLIKDATRWAYNCGGAKCQEGTDAIYEYLSNYAEITKGTKDYSEENVIAARRMAYNIKDFTSTGTYGRFFCGKSTVNISGDDFVVIELENIKADPELFGVVILQMMNEITQDLYLSDRKSRRFILFEEAPSFLKDNGNKDLTRLGDMIDEGYRRARKYGGAFGLVMQSIMDTQLMGKAGIVALQNASYKLMLSSKGGQYAKAAKAQVIEKESFALGMLNSLRNNKPKYSEIYIESPQGDGVARLIVDPFRYKVNTTEAHEVAVFIEALAAGKTPLQAVEAIGA